VPVQCAAALLDGGWVSPRDLVDSSFCVADCRCSCVVGMAYRVAVEGLGWDGEPGRAGAGRRVRLWID